MPDPTAIAAFRFGFGLPLPRGGAAEPEAMLAMLAGPDVGAALWPGPPPEMVRDLQDRTAEARRLLPTPDAGLRQNARDLTREVMLQEEGYLRRALARAIDSPDALRERLVWFWQDHFTTTAKRHDQYALMASRIDHAIRPDVAGRFADMLRTAILHPSMLIFLDQITSFGPRSRAGKRQGVGLNENLARELMELHTLGVGADYSQRDVRQLAKLLTGLSVRNAQGTVFFGTRSEPGAERVLGQIYRGPGVEPILQVLDDLARRPETAQHLSRKLARHFLSDTPDEGLIARMAAAYMANDTALWPVYAVLLRDPAALDPAARKARMPAEFMACALRALGLDGLAVMAMPQARFQRHVRRPMAAMGQDWERASGPDGWAEDVARWISPQGLAARISWAMESPAVLVRGDPTGTALAAAADRPALPDPRQLLDRALGPVAGPVLRTAVARAESAREAVGLVLAAPEFNRR